MAVGYPSVGQHFISRGGSIAEDVSNIIYQITPDDTPFFQISGDGEANDVIHIWQTRNVTTRQVNVNPEGYTWDFSTAQRVPSRLSNLTQIFHDDIRVSRTQQSIRHHAIPNMLQDQVETAMIEHKTDIEHALIQGTMVTGSTTSTAQSMQGIINHIVSGVSGYTTFAVSTTFNEDALNDALERSWDLGGRPKDVLVHGPMKRRISTFSTGANNPQGGTRVISADEQRLVGTISTYESDFGTVQAHLSRDIPSAGKSTIAASYSGFGIVGVDRTMVSKSWIDRTFVQRAPKTADSDDAVITSECTLEVGHRSAHFYIANAQ